MNADDLFRVQRADKSKPLRCTESTRETTCVLCDGPISPDEWVVRLPDRLGIAHPHCAGDRGWSTT